MGGDDLSVSPAAAANESGISMLIACHLQGSTCVWDGRERERESVCCLASPFSCVTREASVSMEGAVVVTTRVLSCCVLTRAQSVSRIFSLSFSPEATVSSLVCIAHCVSSASVAELRVPLLVSGCCDTHLSLLRREMR